MAVNFLNFSLYLCSYLTVGMITALPYEYNSDGSVNVTYKVSLSWPEENKVTWIWDIPSLTIRPGEQQGNFTAFHKVVSNQYVWVKD